MNFELPVLPYDAKALEPVISASTLNFHHGKHHQTYVTNLNQLIKGTKFENSSLEDIVKSSEGSLFNNAAQVWNHTFYFEGLRAPGSYEINPGFNEAINKSFGSLAALKESFNKAGASLFGSGWVWLVKNKQGSLEILQEVNAGNPLRKGLIPILTCDVWEHAYYLDFQNKRADYLNAFWGLVNWAMVEKRYFA